MTPIGPRRAGRARLLLGTLIVLLGFATSVPAAGAATGVSNITVSNATPSPAARALTTYQIGFKTSASGALLGTAGASISIRFPTGTVLDNITTSPVKVGTTQVGYCIRSADSPPTATCYIYSGSSVGASTTAALTINGVNNTATAGTAYTVQVSTTADTVVQASPVFSVTTAKAVSKPAVTIATPSAAASALTTYAITFNTSATGGLAGTAGSSITITVPSGTDLTPLTTSPLRVGTTQVGYCIRDSTSPLEAVCYVYSGSSVANSTAVSITLNGVHNPGAAGSKTLAVTTTSDTKSIASAAYVVSAASSISGLTATNTPPSSSANALTTYTIGFTTSATGGLAGAAGSSITVTFPTGTGLADMTTSPLRDGATQVGYCIPDSTSPLDAVCYVYNGSTVIAGDALELRLNGVNNPAGAGSKTLQISTTSDTLTATSPAYTVGAVTTVSGASIALGSTTTSATTTYTLKFTATTGLLGAAGSSISVGFPNGTNLTALTTSPLKVGATQVGYCIKDAASLTSVICYVYNGTTVNAGDQLVASLNGVKNPATTNQYSLKVSTTSDTKLKSLPYCVAAAGVPCITKFSPATGPVGTAVTVTGVNLGAATAVHFNGTAAAILTNTAKKITTTVPPGATTGTITVTTGGGTATSSKQFTVI